MSSDLLSAVVQVASTLAIFTFLWKDNPVYKLAEHLFVGVATGWFIVTQYRDVFLPNLYDPLRAGLAGQAGAATHWPGLFVPLVLGLLLFTRYVPQASWLSRWSMAAIVGTYSGLAIKGFASGDLFLQTRSNLVPLVDPAAARAFAAGPGLRSLLELLRNPVLVVGVVSVLVYFFFSVPHKGAVGKVSTLGIWFLMVSFGASYGNTVMARISLFIGRADFLLNDRTDGVPHWVLTVGLGTVLILALAVHERRSRRTGERETA